jgi:large subunit ribosomal protein L23
MSELSPYQIVNRPIITEESQIQTVKGPQYTFSVAPRANKNQIREAIEAIFPDIKVVRVNTMNYDGKVKRQLGSRKVGRRAKWKKAIVTLRDGDSIEMI